MLNGETVSNVFIGKHGSDQIAHDLMHLDQDLPSILRVKGNRLDVGIDLAPLLRPVSADFFRSTDKTAFERLRLSHVRSHEGEGSIDVTHVEGRIRCA
jgi:hypothetical protein